MNRRELLKPLAALTLTPLLVKGRAEGEFAVVKSVSIDPERKYVIFVDGDMIDAAGLAEALSGGAYNFPQGTPIYAVLVQPGKTIDDAIRIFEVK